MKQQLKTWREVVERSGYLCETVSTARNMGMYDTALDVVSLAQKQIRSLDEYLEAMKVELEGCQKVNTPKSNEPKP